ncbi:DUF2127 domain-containing protein [Lactococcus lactis]|uniref:DUF2127 domain-containing protein n=1 Tax=Lactococcus lactis TaxID=1358 RepID=UPI0028808CE6|nr:DUF2127 domain-containing protein [Lactococcus lactis]MCT1226074.1 DUF2127 domain-containing protein [Lactococcus lactis]
MNKVKNKEELLDVSFNTMLLGKSIFAFVEFISGLLLIFVPLDLIKATIQHLALGISLSPLSTMITNAGERLTNDATLFAIVYLLLHGALKLVTLALLWKKILWSYPLSILLLVGFILYQIFEFFNHGSISMLVLCAVDVLMIILTLLEYRKLKTHISKEDSYSSLKNSKVN